MSKEST